MLIAAISLPFDWRTALLASLSEGGELSHADPVVPILIASIFITMGAALGGWLMKWMKQPAVLGAAIWRSHPNDPDIVVRLYPRSIDGADAELGGCLGLSMF